MQLNPVLLAALALPGIALAETPPERGQLSLKYLAYDDRQPGLERIKVRSPSLSVVAPVAGQWSIAGTVVSDDVSGASPRYHTAVSGASRMDDERHAADVRVTRYFERGSVGAGLAWSKENDYRSRAWSLQANLESEDKNTTVTVGLGGAGDDINPVNLRVKNERKNTHELLLGLTQVFTQDDIGLVNVTRIRGMGYFSDPYKQLDNRPRTRDQDVVLLRWNHHVPASEGTMRLSFRHYRDSWGVKAHTWSLDYVQPMAKGWQLTPSARFHRQSAADFYFGPVYDADFGAPFPPGYQFGSKAPTSADQRLSAFRALTIGAKLEKDLGGDWSADLKLERYRQYGAAGLQPLTARMLQLGVSKRF